MAYETLKQAIANVIRTNGNQEITGALLQQILTSMVNTLGAKYQFAGVATLNTNPGVPDGPVFYLASTSGNYSYFGLTIPSNVNYLCAFMWNGSQWLNERIADLGLATADVEYDGFLERMTLSGGKFAKDIEGTRKFTISSIEGNTVIKGDFLISTVATAITLSNGISIPLPITSLFSTGIKRAGTAFDEINATQKIQRVGEIDLGTLTWNYSTTAHVFYAALSSVAHGAYADAICPRYSPAAWVNTQNTDKTFTIGEYVTWGIHIHDDSFNGDTVAFKNTMAGVMMQFRLKNEIVSNVANTVPISFEIDKDTTYSIGSGAPLIVLVSPSLKSRIDSSYAMRTRWAWTVDHSAEKKITLPIPRKCAKVNIISDTGLATTKTDNKKGVLEYYDGGGNYFRKYILLNAQGTSSMVYEEKNQSIDLFNDDGHEESCDIIFDNWVPQDSFHLKCYYIDVFRGISNVAYNFAEECIRHLDIRTNRVIFDRESITESNGAGDFATDFGDGALCHPDGFPFELYVNGDYYGLFAWNLKKHRKNYSMEKNDYTKTILDGVVDGDTFFFTLDWTQFELRSPKELVTQDGKEYDGENPTEIMGTDSSYYNASNPVHKGTAELKAILVDHSTVIARVDACATANEKRAILEEYYDIPAVCGYINISTVLSNVDGFRKNWQWTLYNGKLAPNIYDCDTVFGRVWTGLSVTYPGSISQLLGRNSPVTLRVIQLYGNILKSQYASLRDAGIISVDNIMRYVDDWIARCGREAIKRNIEKWPYIPSYRPSDTPANMTPSIAAGGMYDSPYRIRKWLEERIASMDAYYSYTEA